MNIRINARTKLKLSVVDAQGAVGTNKEYTLLGSKSTAIKKFSKMVSVPSSVLYTLRQEDKATHTYPDGTKLIMEIISEEKPTTIGVGYGAKANDVLGEVSLAAGVDSNSETSAPK